MEKGQAHQSFSSEAHSSFLHSHFHDCSCAAVLSRNHAEKELKRGMLSVFPNNEWKTEMFEDGGKLVFRKCVKLSEYVCEDSL